MSIGEYITVFAAIVVGLAVVELIVSFHRLLRQGHEIRWDWMTPLFALIVFAFILNLWWALFRWYGGLDAIAFWRFLPDIAVLVTLSLLAASVLPDGKLPVGGSLRDFYMETRRQSWWLLGCYCLVAAARAVLDPATGGRGLMAWLVAAGPNLIIALAAFGLGITRRAWVHGTGLILLLAVVLSFWLNARLQ